MTREEAVNELNDRIKSAEYVDSDYIDCVSVDAVKMAISALSVPETNVGDTISRQAAIDAIWEHLRNILKKVNFKDSDDDRPVRDAYKMAHQHLAEVIESLPSAEPDLDEWCTDCKEYDQERHCCPRWNRVIRETLKDAGLERKKGRWQIRETADGDVEAKCPCCGFETLVNQPGNGLHMVNDLHFCPNCGLPMEEGEKDAD